MGPRWPRPATAQPGMHAAVIRARSGSRCLQERRGPGELAEDSAWCRRYRGHLLRRRRAPRRSISLSMRPSGWRSQRCTSATTAWPRNDVGGEARRAIEPSGIGPTMKRRGVRQASSTNRIRAAAEPVAEDRNRSGLSAVDQIRPGQRGTAARAPLRRLDLEPIRAPSRRWAPLPDVVPPEIGNSASRSFAKASPTRRQPHPRGSITGTQTPRPGNWAHAGRAPGRPVVERLGSAGWRSP